MALAPKLEFRQSQQLVMTPQLQQAIKLLQLSNLELAEYVEDQIEQNPLLERPDAEAAEPADAADAGEAQSANADETPIDLSRDETAHKARDDLDLDNEDGEPGAGRAAEADYKVNEWASVGNGGSLNDEDREFGATLKQEISLRDHLGEQLKMATRSPFELFLGSYLIDLIDDAGYLREGVQAIAERLGAEESDVERVLAIIQNFDPSGVGARDFKECLKLQLIERDRYDPAMAAFVDNIELLAKGDLKALMKATGADEEDVRDMIAEVRSLTPKPGYAYGGETVQVVAPDVFVSKAADGGWKIELNNETMPKVLVNQRYYAEISKKASSRDADKVFLNEQLANANWLVKSLDQRARTILKVASEIVRQQDGFFVFGVRHLRPLNLKVVADAISMHESTVSRVTANKYMATPRGLFELKYFFTAAIASSEGGEAHSAEAVRHRIRELIASEDPGAILSDDRIVEILRDAGVEIARRTVAKYRETLNIPSSVQRRRQAVSPAI
ncbi:MAG: RNA polymerase factor sigma-54 [Parvularculaceae bacterium]